MNTIKKGSKGTDVLTLQKALSSATNYFKGAWDGVFGKETEATVKTFQKYSGLTVDGVVGPKTWEALSGHIPQESSQEEPRTEHFKMSEFKCKDGTSVPKEYWPNLQALMNWLEKGRAHFGKRITVNSGYRTPTYNKKVDGAKNSQHLYGAAADIVVEGVKPSEVYKYFDGLMKGCGGVGKYATFTHIDCRNKKARW